MTPAWVRVLKVLVFLLCLVPLGKLVLETLGVAGLSLGANPVEELIHRCGKWGLNFLLITLAVTPLRRLTGAVWLIRFRRMLGLFAFFYVLLHFLMYAGLDQRFDLGVILEDIAKRPYITVGFTALLLLVPLALTSTNRMMRRLGRNWKKLHRLVYAIAILGAWHFYWQVKLDTLEPLIYIGILAVLLGYRIKGKIHGHFAHPR
jgi:sulfoxide reductase heme-binding subunit YedZ